MSKKNAHVESVSEEVETVAEYDDAPEMDSIDESGIPTINVGDIEIKAPDKFSAGHVLNENEARHLANLVRTRFAQLCENATKRKRNPKVWSVDDLEEEYSSYVLGAPRSAGPSDDEILDEALDALLEEIAAQRNERLPAGKGSKAKRAEYKAALAKLPHRQERIAELCSEIRAEYAAKASKKIEKKPATLSLEDLF